MYKILLALGVVAVMTCGAVAGEISQATLSDMGLAGMQKMSDDEGMAVQGGTFRYTGLDKDKAVKALLDFNNHQDFEKMVKEAGYQT